jgi:hypothetical protein
MCYVSVAEVYGSFGKFSFLHHELTLMMEATEPSEAVALFCWVIGFKSQKTAVLCIGKSFGKVQPCERTNFF